MTEPVENAVMAISQAEQELAKADDIVSILNIRDRVRALEALARIADAQFEIEQQATIIRLKTERKAGHWLTNNIQHGGHPKSHDVTLTDLGISKSQSSRWQIMAKLTDEKFYGWIDHKIERGYDISAAGLLRYAQNVMAKNGQKTTEQVRIGQVFLNPPDGDCWLKGYAIKCDGHMTGGHIINKSKTRGNAEGRAILASCPKEIMAPQCQAHNQSRWADTPTAVKIMLLQKIYQFGYLHMHEWFEQFLGTFKVRPTELELERLIS